MKEEDFNGSTKVSLYIIRGSQTPQTMKVKAWINQVPLTVLIDSGSTHNFLNLYIAKKAGLLVKKGIKLKVSVAHGKRMPWFERCDEVKMKVQGISVVTKKQFAHSQQVWSRVWSTMVDWVWAHHLEFCRPIHDVLNGTQELSVAKRSP